MNSMIDWIVCGLTVSCLISRPDIHVHIDDSDDNDERNDSNDSDDSEVILNKHTDKWYHEVAVPLPV